MKIRISRSFLLLIFLTASLLSVAGCAQQMKSIKPAPPAEPTANAVIKSILFSDDASRIEVNTDKPVVYTYYMLEKPPRLIVDLAQTTAGTLLLPMDVNKGLVKRLDIAKHEFGSGVLSRIDITLADTVEVDATHDSKDTNKLVFVLHGVKGAGDAAPVTAVAAATLPIATPAAIETAPARKESVTDEKPAASLTPPAEPPASPITASVPVSAAPQVEPQAKPKALPVGSPRSLTAITKGSESIDIEISAPVESFRAFKLSQPERLVIDIANTKNLIAARQVDINKFNLGKARIGGTAEKLRVVFDANSNNIPPYHVIKVDSGLQIMFAETAAKAAVDREEPPLEKPVTQAAATGAAPAAAPPVIVSVPGEQAPPEKTVTIAPVAEPTAAPITKEKTVVETAAPTLASVAVPLPALVSSPPPAESKSVSKPVPNHAANEGSVDAIEFTQADGFSLITVRTSGTCVVGQPVKTAKALQLILKDCRLPIKLQRSLVTTGFESVIKEITPYPVKTKKGYETRIAVKMKGSVPNFLKKEGKVWQWEFREPVKPVKMTRIVRIPQPTAPSAASLSAGIEREFAEPGPESARAKQGRTTEDDLTLVRVSQPVAKPSRVYTGRKVSLEFSDADIRKIFQLIAEVSNQNFLISDDVSGTISLKLVNVPWDQALDVILENKGLGMQKEGNIVQIRPKSKMKSLDDEAIEMRLSEEKKMPLSTVIFDINYATLGDIENQFSKIKSSRASISPDARTNKLIVVDIEPNIKKMRKLLDSLDIPEKQVMIEARIVEASSTFARDIGVKWDFGVSNGSASVANINNITGSMGGIVSSILPSTTTGGLATAVSFGKLLSNIQLDMRLSAAATVGQVKIISTPRVLTVNNKAAKISQGQMVPYQNTSSTEGAKTEFIEAALSLEVTPHITADGSVSMKIKASNNSVGTGSPPPINKKEATTELVVKNGETTVIGGIYVDSDTEGDTGIPYLSDIPLLGWLFKSNSKNKTKNELLIFITPKIMN